MRICELGLHGAGDRAREIGVTEERIAEVVGELRTDGLIDDDGATPRGKAFTDQLLSARRELMSEALDDPVAEERPEVAALLRELSAELVGERP